MLIIFTTEGSSVGTGKVLLETNAKREMGMEEVKMSQERVLGQEHCLHSVSFV